MTANADHEYLRLCAPQKTEYAHSYGEISGCFLGTLFISDISTSFAFTAKRK